MKSTRKWLETLREPYRARALNNAYPFRLEVECYSLSNALGTAFNWAGSPEKHEYWKNVRDNIKNYTKRIYEIY